MKNKLPKELKNIKFYVRSVNTKKLITLYKIIALWKRTLNVTDQIFMNVVSKYVMFLSYSKLIKAGFFPKKICFLTQRARSVYKLSMLSRLKTRYYASNGYLTGLKKSSW